MPKITINVSPSDVQYYRHIDYHDIIIHVAIICNMPFSNINILPYMFVQQFNQFYRSSLVQDIILMFLGTVILSVLSIG